MLSVPVDELTDGMVLARAVPNPQRVQDDLLKAGFELTREVIDRIVELGVRNVWIAYPGLEFLDEQLDSPVFETQRVLAGDIRQGVEAVQKGTVQRVNIQRYRQSLQEMIRSILDQPTGFALLQRLDVHNCGIVSHSVSVAYLSLMLGMKLDAYLIRERRRLAPHEAKSLTDLGLGAMVHDIGYVAGEVDWPIFERNLTGNRKELFYNHPRIGYEMLKSQVPPNTAHILLNHHQRFDGGGFPKIGEEHESAIGKQVSVLARIVAICNAFDRLAESGDHRLATVKVLAAMKHGCAGWFDPEIEAAFRQIVPPFEIGSKVVLSDGRSAVVIGFNPNIPTRPEVQIVAEDAGTEPSAPGKAAAPGPPPEAAKAAAAQPATGAQAPAAEATGPPPIRINLSHADFADLSIQSIGGEDVSKYVAALELDPAAAPRAAAE
jgi:HD-GYP domain-containing protein (c-di-GMP phosphodiesterase class II)